MAPDSITNGPISLSGLSLTNNTSGTYIPLRYSTTSPIFQSGTTLPLSYLYGSTGTDITFRWSYDDLRTATAMVQPEVTRYQAFSQPVTVVPGDTLSVTFVPWAGRDTRRTQEVPITKGGTYIGAYIHRIGDKDPDYLITLKEKE